MLPTSPTQTHRLCLVVGYLISYPVRQIITSMWFHAELGTNYFLNELHRVCTI
ncbi:hypothetical protein SAMD00023353_6100390 [Rosellinia necatrix]|uniref:Uncharacterized protein n=1 Tax=Rosellinia necatrix TaxID=77044 RepID=A0A1S8AAN1_ROSNE|nr:hypothetical protein SAMD00023353_6100390 [Rosellinia necatrix]